MNVQERLRELKRQERQASKAVLAAGLALVFLVGWGIFAKIDQIVVADGELLPPSRPQTIQNLEGGILRELVVSEGDQVAQGQLLGRLHSESYESELAEIQDRLAALVARRHRLEAAARQDTDLNLPEDLARDYPSIVDSETALLAASLQKRAGELKLALDAAAVSRHRVALLTPLVKKKLVPEIDLLSAQKTYLEAQKQIEQIKHGFELTRAEHYAETLQEIAGLQQASRATADKLDRSNLRAPVDGLVNKISITTIGGVIGSGQEILEIVPQNEGYLIEARVKPADIALVSVGQSAHVRIPALENEDKSLFQGQVIYVAAYTQEEQAGLGKETFFKVRIEIKEFLDASFLRDQLRPGMVASASLVAKRTSVLRFLLEPLFGNIEQAAAI